MQKISIVSTLILITSVGLALVSNIALAQVDLPKATERKPNLSLDPFERARESIRGLPTDVNTKEPEREQQREDVKIITPAQGIPEPQAPEEESGEAFSYGVAAIADYFNRVNGRSRNDAAQAGGSATPVLLDLAGEIDTGAAGLWDNGTIMAHMMIYGGTSPGDLLGDFHGVSNIDAGGETVIRLLEAWYQHEFEHGKSTVLVGLHDWNSEFYIAEYANLFMNGAFGMGGVIGAVAGPSAYPATTVGVRYFSELTPNSYFQLGVYDGVADEANFFEVNLNKNEGFFVGMEAGVSDKEPGENGYYKIAVGGWYLRTDINGYTGVEDQEAFVAQDGTETLVNTGNFYAPGTNGAYLLAETAIGDNIGVFFKAGWADPLYNRFSQFYAGGLNYTGLIPGRVDDVFGLAVTQSRQGQNFQSDNSDGIGNNLSYNAETTYELTYTVQLKDWLVIQPDLQYIRFPGFSYDLTDFTVVGIRAAAEF